MSILYYTAGMISTGFGKIEKTKGRLILRAKAMKTRGRCSLEML